MSFITLDQSSAVSLTFLPQVGVDEGHSGVSTVQFVRHCHCCRHNSAFLSRLDMLHQPCYRFNTPVITKHTRINLCAYLHCFYAIFATCCSPSILLAVVSSAEQCSNTLSQLQPHNKCVVCCFLFDCSAYSDDRQKHDSLFLQTTSVSHFLTNSESNACGGFLREYFSHIKSIVST